MVQLRLRGVGIGSDESEFREQGRALGLSSTAMVLLHRRGITELDQQRRWLAPKLADLRPPQGMAGFEAALDLLVTARKLGLRIGVFGDYDVDGVTTAAILSGYLQSLGLQVVTRVARRDSGYGFGLDDAIALRDAGAKVVLTGDCGTSDHEALSWLQGQGIAAAVIDHHQVPESLPPVQAIINPHRGDCKFPFKGLCSAGVAFYLCAALRTTLRQHAGDRSGDELPDPRDLLDLVALGTVCDMVPLREENRVLVSQGLLRLRQGGRPGLQALANQAGIEAGSLLDEEHLGFRFGPRLNAPGRFGAAEPSLRLLQSESAAEAQSLAHQLEVLNTRRRHETSLALADAETMLVEHPEWLSAPALVLAKDTWLPGLVGIVASGVVGRFHKPTAVLAIDRETQEARGSVRSCSGVDVRAALQACSDLLVRSGGHREAAGLTLRAENLDRLREAFSRAVADQLQGSDDGAGAILHDGELPLQRIDNALLHDLSRLGPFGVGFPRPEFLCNDAVIEDIKVLKGKHLALALRQGPAKVDAICFDAEDISFRRGDRIGCTFTLSRDTFRGRTRTRMQLEHLWRA